MSKKFRVALLFLITFSFPFTLWTACNNGDPLQQPVGLLYVADQPGKAIYVLEPVSEIDGGTDPSRTISGDKTMLTKPTAVVVDGLRDILYVSDSTERKIFVYAPASTVNGDVTPRRILPTTGDVIALSLDTVNDRLFALNITDLSILVWNNVSTLDNANPNNIFFLDFVPSNQFYDNRRDILYLGAPFARAVNAFAQASTLIGNVFPSRILFDTEHPFDEINALTMNVDNDILYLVNAQSPEIDVFLNTSTLNGEIEPDRIVEGDQTQLSDKMRFVYFLENILYLNNRPTEIAIWNNANSLDGNTAPDRLVTVNGATQIVGFDIDLLH